MLAAALLTAALGLPLPERPLSALQAADSALGVIINPCGSPH